MNKTPPTTLPAPAAIPPGQAKEAPEESVAGEEDPGAALDLPVVRPKEDGREGGQGGKAPLPDPGPGV